MKASKILVIVLVVLGVLLIGGAFYANSYVQTPEFKQQMLAKARDAIGADVEIEEIDMSIFSGVTLQRVVISNPKGFRGHFLTAEEVVLRHRLLPLLFGTLKIDELSLQRPVVRLIRSSGNVWNFQRLASLNRAATRRVSTTAPLRNESLSDAASFDIAISQLAMEDGNIEVVDGRNRLLTRMEEVDLTTSLEFIDDKPTGSGDLSVETLNLGDAVFVRNVTSLVEMTGTEVKLNPMSGDLAKGRVSGDVIVQLEPRFKYSTNLQITKADVQTLLQQAGSKQTLSGRLQALIQLAGTGGLPTMSGTGRVNIVDGKLAQTPVQKLVATLLQVPGLGDIDFDEALVEFSLARNVMQTPVIRVTSPEARITGKGSLALATKSLNHNMTLGLPEETMKTMPKAMLFLFTEQSEGYHNLRFHLSGPYNSPRTDIQKRLITAPVKKLLDKGLKGLFGRK